MEEWKDGRGGKGGEDAPETRAGKQKKGRRKTKTAMAPRAKAGENSGKVKGAGSTPGTMQTVMEMTRRNTALKQPEPWEGEALLTFATKFQIPRSTERYLSFDPCGVGIEEAGEPGGYRSAYILVHDRGATRYSEFAMGDMSCPFLSVLCCLLTVLLAIATT
ncbi:hypothetical protein I7I53_11690 [Histoplasma capsulatum var. duboisii H88]|uniref:Uncharacterized protein n=1 Tax=Ajellomyces capsulatus (strain H88) TaxID=544711 RepID=A0A8A1LYL0_AJEC8|nr:hypothetical protein I7I53_11690 [Histoplasma capsulatum var. duboisii H88]